MASASDSHARANIPILKSQTSWALTKRSVTIDDMNLSCFEIFQRSLAEIKVGSDEALGDSDGTKGITISSASATPRTSMRRPSNTSLNSTNTATKFNFGFPKRLWGKPVEGEEDNCDQNSRLSVGLRAELPWYHRTPAYFVALLVVVIINVLLWLLPHSSLQSLLNTAHLQRAGQQAQGTVGLCAFATRELLLRDGFSFLSSAELHSFLSVCAQSFREQFSVMRQGGITSKAASRIQVFTGADFISSPVMDQYKAAMYEVL